VFFFFFWSIITLIFDLVPGEPPYPSWIWFSFNGPTRHALPICDKKQFLFFNPWWAIVSSRLKHSQNMPNRSVNSIITQDILKFNKISFHILSFYTLHKLPLILYDNIASCIFFFFNTERETKIMSQKEGVLSTILFNFSWFEYNNLLHLRNMNNYTNKRYISM